MLRRFAAVDVAVAHRGRIAGEVVRGGRCARAALRRLRGRLDILRRGRGRERRAAGGEEKRQEPAMSSHRVLRALVFDPMRQRQLLTAFAALLLSVAVYADATFGSA